MSHRPAATDARVCPRSPSAWKFRFFIASTLTVVGQIVGWIYERRADRTRDLQGAKQLGVLLASELIVGGSFPATLFTTK